MTSSEPSERLDRNAPYAPTPDNRPAVLDPSPLALTRESASQMSFGERAAVEGVLAQLRPTLAVEIGTAEGGNLTRIAAYTQEVHSVDVSYTELAASPRGNVHLHLGPSAQILPPLLEGFSAARRTLDFALVDGDHSFEGVAGDLRALLVSPCTRRSVILVHDTMNPEIRAGIEHVGLDSYEKVVYYELDFVPGYIYRSGSAQGAMWGGLGVILCDAVHSEAYSPSGRQWRYYEPFEAMQRWRAELSDHGGKR